MTQTGTEIGISR